MQPEPSVLSTAPRLHVRVAISIFFFVSGFSFATWASRIPTLQQLLHLTEGQLGTVLFALPMGLLLTMPLTGFLLSRYSSRYIMMGGAILFCLLLCGLGLVSTPWQLAIVLFFFGASRNFLNIAMNAQAVSGQALYEKSIMASFHGVWSVAGFAGAALGSVLISQHVNILTHVCIVASTMIVFAAFSYPYTYKDTVAAADRPKRPAFALPSKPLLQLGLVTFCSMTCEGTMFDWSGIYFHKVVQVPNALTNLGYTAYMCANAAGRFTGDSFVNRFGAFRVLMVSGLFVITGMLIAVAVPSVPVATTGFIITGLGLSCVSPLVFSLAGKMPGATSGASIAGMSTVGYLGFLIGPPAIGYLAEAAGLRWAFALVSALGLVLTYLVMRLRAKAGRESYEKVSGEEFGGME